MLYAFENILVKYIAYKQEVVRVVFFNTTYS
jgi:hypothetical protein